MAESEGDAFQPARSGMIEIANLTFIYPYGTTPALESLNLTIPGGQVVLLTGVSGCGKSTLVRCLNGLIPHSQGGRYSGTIAMDGSEIAKTPIRDLATKVGGRLPTIRNPVVQPDRRGRKQSVTLFSTPHPQAPSRSNG